MNWKGHFQNKSSRSYQSVTCRWKRQKAFWPRITTAVSLFLCGVMVSGTESYWASSLGTGGAEETVSRGKGTQKTSSYSRCDFFPLEAPCTAWESCIWPLPPLPMHRGWYPALFWRTWPQAKALASGRLPPGTWAEDQTCPSPCERTRRCLVC